jgi:hypothetical protein
MWAIIAALVVAFVGTFSVRAQGNDEDLGARYALPDILNGVNTAKDEYAPRYDPLRKSFVYATERNGFAETWWCALGSHAEEFLKDPSPADGTFNESGRQRAFVTFSADGAAMGVAYLRRGASHVVGVITVPRDGGKLNTGLPVDVCNASTFSSYPALSPDGTRLVFASKREGSSLDLFMSERLPGGEWREPVVLSSVLNSPHDEITPCFLSNDSLLFASNGAGGRGGYDLFLTVYVNGTWQEPEPLEWLNSEFDESDCSRMPDGSFIFTSNRPGGPGGYDLYRSSPLQTATAP